MAGKEHLGIPIRVIYNDCVSGRQSDALPARARGQQKYEAVRALCQTTEAKLKAIDAGCSRYFVTNVALLANLLGDAPLCGS